MSEILGTHISTPTQTDIGFKDTDTHADKIATDQTPVDGGDAGWNTGVNDIKAAAEKGGLPVFDVTPAEFYNNMKLDRRKMVFKRGTPTQAYHQGTNYKQYFWIRNTDDGYMVKVGPKNRT